MRIRVLSDLHREFAHIDLPQVEADVVVLAGDTDRGTCGVTWAASAFPNTPVLYVAGNHEFYDERIGRLHEKLRAAATGTNVAILENETCELAGYRFFGATLWTDFNLFGDQPSAMLAAGAKIGGMTDYRKIRRQDTSRLMPKHTAKLHADSRLALMKFLTSGDPTKSVVITHHAPSARSVQTGKEADPLTPAYASNLERLIEECGPALWIHGHIHEFRDYQIGNTRVLNNPLGYQTAKDRERSGFVCDLVVEPSRAGTP
jgi:predicted phosphodiesterase